MSHKALRMEEDIKRQISYLIKNLKNMSLKSKEISVSRVEMSDSFKKVRVYISSLKGIVYARQSLKILNNALGFIKHEISKNLRLKKVPHIEFLADDSLEYESHLQELFSKIKRGI